MEKTVVFITGSSSGIGAATVEYLLKKNINICAGVRSVEKAKHLEKFAKENNYDEQLLLVTCDVTDEKSIETAVKKSIDHFGKIDVLINNAGFSIVGAIEDFSTEELRTQYDTNLFGVHRMISALLPHFRAQKKGTIINITSMGGRVTFPFYAVYNSSKYALESYTEGLWMELRKSPIHVYAVEPGLIATQFYSASMKFPKNWKETKSIYKNLYEDYTAHPEHIAFNHRSSPEVVAKKVYELIIKSPSRLRHPVGNFAGLILFARWLLPDMIFLPLMAQIRG